MDLVTHLLASYTVGRTARARINSPLMAAALLAGTAPDIDRCWHLSGPLAAMRAYGTSTHSLPGAAALAAAIAAAVWAATRHRTSASHRLPALLAATFSAAGLHLLLDVSTGTGIEPWWPFLNARAAWNLTPSFDVVTVLLLVFFAVLPLLLVMIKEEIGVPVDPEPSRVWPIAALLLVGMWLGVRAEMHHRAEKIVSGAVYHGGTALHWAAFPAGASPFRWRGVVETEALLADVEVVLESGQPFAPDAAVLYYKPDPSPIVDAVAAAPLARAYTALARFPLLNVETRPDGARAELRELGDSLLHTRDGSWAAQIDLDLQPRVTHETLFYLPARPY